MYRAVKVVRREDFEYERTFEREFEGIQKYEKVSHEHPGLVDVLHVGRDDEAGFYYYVMELADDESGEPAEARVESYKPRTLSSDLRRRSVRTVRECVDLGVAIGGALGHLHRAGLTHRDVKPSNIIFVKGQPKLADVGLVASTGQRTFVGTEGYVPPEGPGTSSADLYSLAMVLYEMHTGKDRLDFPELPTNLEIPPSVNRDEWRALNSVICRAGSPDPRKRYESAQGLVGALGVVCAAPWKATAPKRSTALPALFGTAAVLGLLAIAGAGGWWLWQDNRNFVAKHSLLLTDRGDEPGVNGSRLRTPVGGVTPIEPGAPERVGPGTVEGPVKAPEKEPTPPEPALEPKPEPKQKPEPAPPAKTEPAEPEPEKPPGPALTAQVVQGRLKITSQPPAAAVFYEGEEIGTTETRPLEFAVGPVELVLKREGYHDYVYRGEVKEGTRVVNAILLPDLSPVAGQPWTNSLGMEFAPVGEGRHQSIGAVTVALFDRFLEETGEQIPTSGKNGIVHVSDDRALWRFCDWLTEQDRRTGRLDAKRYYRPLRSERFADGDKSFFATVEREFGTLSLNSDPSGAQVYRGGSHLGETPLVVNDLRLGFYELELFKPGHKAAVAAGDLKGGEPQDQVVTLEPDGSAVFGQRWRNSQGMELVPVGGLLVASTETTTRAWFEYLAEHGVVLDPATAASGLDYPAYGIGYADAVAFCAWLTKRERSAGWIRPWQRYRLPTDLEWSRFVGLARETGSTPEERNRGGAAGFPWGPQWPPPTGAGNFADASAAPFFGGKVIAGYSDGFATTAPVGSFGASPLGLHDLAGNVWEWVLDPYTDGSDGLQVVRGGGWNSFEREILATAYRNPVPATAREDFHGFRYVLEDEGE